MEVDESDSPKIHLALLVSTYRLSHQRPERCPPFLVHRSRVPMDPQNTIDLSQLPFTLTWLPESLYVTYRHDELLVYRIKLFPDSNETPYEERREILTLQGKAILPRTARERNVYYVPPIPSNNWAQVIVGHEMRGKQSAEDVVSSQDSDTNHGKYRRDTRGSSRGELHPPVGCYFDEEEHLDGWRKLEEHPPTAQHLDIQDPGHRREMFNSEEDCECELFTKSLNL